MKILHKPFGFKACLESSCLMIQTSNPVINLDHDDDWVLKGDQSLAECGIGMLFVSSVHH